jgi:predicted small integral membrane protein
VSAFLAKMFVALLISGVIKVGWLALGNDLSWWIAMLIAMAVVFAACRMLAEPEQVAESSQAEVR